MPAAPPPLSLALKYLREAAGLSQQEMQALTGVSEALLGHYERGRKRLARERLDRLAEDIGFGPESVELAVLAANGLSGGPAGVPASPAYPSPAERQVAERTAALVAGAALTLTRADILRQAREARVARANQAAGEQWIVLQRCTTGERRLLIEKSAEYRNWALSVRLGDESVRAAARNVHLAIELAGLALTAAELAAGDDAWRSRLTGRARGFVANALRVEFNLGANLCDLGRFAEAAARLPELRKVSAALGNEVDGAKVSWLDGRVASGLGRRAEARTALERARGFFAEAGKTYDAALVSLDIAVLHLEEGNTAAVRQLAVTMASIFRSEGIAREGLAALRLFYDAALQERITLDEVRGILARVKQLGGSP